MSLRLDVRGFELAKLRALLGCGDPSVAERVCAEIARSGADAAQIAASQEVARRATLDGVPFVGLADEGNPHVSAATALATIDQTLDSIDSSSWTLTPVWDLQIVDADLAAVGAPFRVFVDGRPLFGTRFNPGWGYYGFLDTREVERLRVDLESTRATLAAAPEPVRVAPATRASSIADLKRVAGAVEDDEALHAFLSRLLSEGIGLGERSVKDLAFAGAKRRGWPQVPAIRRVLEAFLARFRNAEANADPRRLVPFVDELDGWLHRIASGGRDLFFVAA